MKYAKLISLYFVLAVPVLLTLLNVRLVMTPIFLQFEYNRPDFPEDTYGLTREERLEYAPYALDYLINNEAIDYLGDLTFPDGTPLYNERELSHMEDVQAVTQAAFAILLAGGIVAILLGFLLFKTHYLYRSLMQGSLLTIGLIGVIVVSAVVAWDFFFTAFHQMFFESGTWRFYFSDTLIRLFPERFWFDAAIFIGVLTALEAIVILLVTWRWRKQLLSHNQS